jgi:hypothetical protein
MNRLRRPRSGKIWPLLLLLCCVGCSRPGSNRGTVEAGQRPVPFREGSESGDTDLGSGASPTVQEKGSVPEAGVPFRDSQSLPAGTLLTVRLKNPISSDRSEAASAFAAVVDDPVVVEGMTLVSRGASVTGRVESARSSPMNGGYLRLSLDMLESAGRDLPIQTSSLFARGKAAEPGSPDTSGVVRLDPGRRLTFRLTEPVNVAIQAPIPSR